ncbi:MAG: hypothetical protein LEGION0403_FIIPPAGN_02195 [Legionella sp.]
MSIPLLGVPIATTAVLQKLTVVKLQLEMRRVLQLKI